VPFDGAFSPMHWLIVGVVALLVISPSQLPEFARRAGQLMRDAQRVRQHLHAELRNVVSDFDLHGAAPSETRTDSPSSGDVTGDGIDRSPGALPGS